MSLRDLLVGVVIMGVLFVGTIVGAAIIFGDTEHAWALDDLSDECVTDKSEVVLPNERRMVVFMSGDECWVKLRRVEVRR